MKIVKNRKLIQITKYLSSNFLVQILNLLFSFTLIKNLNLEEIGRFNLAKTLSGFFQYTSLGLRYTMDRRLPVGSEALNSRLLNVCLFFSNFISIPLFLFFLVVYGFNDLYIAYSLGGIFFANFTIIKVFYRGEGKVDLFIKTSFYGGILTVAMPFMGLLYFGLYGAVYGYTISTLALVAFYLKKRNLSSLRSVFHLIKTPYFKLLLKVGSPLFLTNIIIFLGDNLDKILVEKVLGLETLGIFSIVLLVYSVASILPSVLVEMYFPDYIKLRQSIGLKVLLKKHILLSSVFICLMCIASYMLIPFIIDLFLSDYVEILPLMIKILLGVLPFSIISPIYCYLFALNESTAISKSKIYSLLFYFTILVYVLNTSQSIEYIVYNKIFSIYLYMLFMIVFYFKASYKNKKTI